MRVGWIGVGSQGGPMARRVVEDGFPTTLWARRPETLEPYRDTSAAYADSPEALAKASDVVCLCVLDDEGVREVGAHMIDGLAEGGVIVVHSTVHPDTCRTLAEQAAARGVAVIDAPVSGGGQAAAERRLLVMAGGDADALKTVRPIFETFANPLLHLGPVGAGQAAKILNNLLLTANLGVAEAAYALGRELGVDLASLNRVFAAGSGNSFAASLLLSSEPFSASRMAEVAGPLLAKDARLAVDLAAAAGVDPGVVLPAADSALQSMHNPR
ncbi:NAD(P)-dependent oxidoreductase [Cryptosporangium phraense]|uniref:NAD(P)-dependent oxidoreductase n=1 Tax=Cryptosporangium phraense TaxID=2593070 RepID=A0A545B098_9ACTN|nr:NAD(P)-dependent oxidoreductase [Cryptosporangium phraense]TQS46988.1 NAD(P)-dependent oxidoreductase [Cryptosporangium phraense]